MANQAEAIGQAVQERNGISEAMDTEQRRYYQLVFIWMKDQDRFGRYLERLRPVVARYGGALERMLLPDAIVAEGMPKPDIVNIVFYDNKEAFTAFDSDPAFQEIVHLRSEAIAMAAIGGLPIGGGVTHERLADRVYLVEIARYGAQGAPGYARYEREAEPVMRRYGYHVERRLAPDAVSGFPFSPDLVTVAYFDSPDGLARFHDDAAHQRLEQELYPAAVPQSLWVTGRVHPTMLGGAPG